MKIKLNQRGENNYFAFDLNQIDADEAINEAIIFQFGL